MSSAQSKRAKGSSARVRIDKPSSVIERELEKAEQAVKKIDVKSVARVDKRVVLEKCASLSSELENLEKTVRSLITASIGDDTESVNSDVEHGQKGSAMEREKRVVAGRLYGLVGELVCVDEGTLRVDLVKPTAPDEVVAVINSIQEEISDQASLESPAGVIYVNCGIGKAALTAVEHAIAMKTDNKIKLVQDAYFLASQVQIASPYPIPAGPDLRALSVHQVALM